MDVTVGYNYTERTLINAISYCSIIPFFLMIVLLIDDQLFDLAADAELVNTDPGETEREAARS